MIFRYLNEGDKMITYNQFCNTFAVSVGSAVFEEVKRRAEHKRNYIISHFGDGNGARLTEKYMLEIMRDELCSFTLEQSTRLAVGGV